MNQTVAEEFKVFLGGNIKPDDWLWCKRCRRCYKASEFRKSKYREQILLLCHYRNCDGDLPLDSRIWSSLAANHPGIPKNPQRGKIYDLEVEFRPKVMNIESIPKAQPESL
jgi:hypothetical protein